MAAAMSPERTVVSGQRPSVSVFDATYFGLVFKASVMGRFGFIIARRRPAPSPTDESTERRPAYLVGWVIV